MRENYTTGSTGLGVLLKLVAPQLDFEPLRGSKKVKTEPVPKLSRLLFTAIVSKFADGRDCRS